MFACHQRDAAEISGDAAPMEACPLCLGVLPARATCPTCEGVGGVDAMDPRRLPEVWAAGGRDAGPEWTRTCAGVLRVWGLVKTYGVDGWMRLDQVEAIDPLVAEAIGVLEAEYARLEHAERVTEAARQRRRQKA